MAPRFAIRHSGDWAYRAAVIRAARMYCEFDGYSVTGEGVLAIWSQQKL